jgi:hypothetical protein
LLIDEVRRYVDKGSKVLEIYEIYEYQVTQYDRITGQAGLFVEYINTCLKFKVEASGYPRWVPSPDDENQYIESFWESEGIRLHKDAI